jgi:hypothetical protein
MLVQSVAASRVAGFTGSVTVGWVGTCLLQKRMVSCCDIAQAGVGVQVHVLGVFAAPPASGKMLMGAQLSGPNKCGAACIDGRSHTLATLFYVGMALVVSGLSIAIANRCKQHPLAHLTACNAYSINGPRPH